jgi:ParB-like chromosome segregation protein Spo0J
MQVNELSLQLLKPYENNPRDNDDAVELVMKSIEEFGFKNPIIVDKDMVIVAGHTRFRAAKRLGLEVAPVIVADDLTEEQVKAFRIMDNKASEMAEWNYPKLMKEIDELELSDYDTDLTGFDMIDLEKIKLEINFGDEALEDPTPDRDSEDETEKEEKNYVIQYNIIFNDEAEQAIWHSYLKGLKEQYADRETIAERIIADIQDRGLIDNE